MNKQELVNPVVAAKSESKTAIDSLIGVASTTVAGHGIVQLIGFGSFSGGERIPRVGRSTASGRTTQIPAAKAAKFTAGNVFRRTVNTS